MMPSRPLFLAFVHSLTRLVRHVESAIFNVELAVVTEVFRGLPLCRRRCDGWTSSRRRCPAAPGSGTAFTGSWTISSTASHRVRAPSR